MARAYSRRLVTDKLVDQLASGDRPQRVAQRLAAYLIDSRQTRGVELYLRDIRQALAERFRYVSAEVSSAHTLTDQLAESIKQFIQRQTAAERVELITQTDPELLSGVVISTTDAVYDGSLRGKIKKLRAV